MRPEYEPEFEYTPVEDTASSAMGTSLVVSAVGIAGAAVAFVFHSPPLMFAFAVIAMLFGMSAALCLCIQSVWG